MRSLAKAIFVAASIFGFAHASFAANYVISPSSKAIEVGDAVTVTVYASSIAQAINVVSGSVTFDPALLRVKSVSTSGSVVKFWITEPSTPKSSASSFKFEGVILNPGYTGASGKVFSITFTAQNEGTATIGISSAAILANDGAGTNVTNATAPLSLSISKPSRPSEVIPVPSAPDTSPVPPATSTDSAQPSASPILKITEIPEKVRLGESFRLAGLSSQGGVSVFVVKTGHVGVLDRTILYTNLTEGGYLLKEEAKVSNGRFQAEFKNLEVGRYAFYARDGDGNVTSIIFVEVVASFWELAKDFALTWWWIPMLALLIMALIYLFWHLAQVRALHHQRLLSDSLSKKYDVYDRMIQKLDLGITLTAEEHALLEKLRGNYKK